MAAPNYYEGINYNYQPYNYSGTPFSTEGFQGAGGSNQYPSTTQNESQAGIPAAANPPNQAGGLFHPPNWLYQPQDATVRAMRQAGYNPASFSPMNQAIIRNAGNFAASLAGRAFGGETLPNITDEQMMLNNLQSMIKNAASGGQVFGGTTPQQMANFSRWTAASNAGSTDPNVSVAAQYLYDPTRASNLAQSLLYSGFAPQFQQAAAAPLLNLGDYYQRLLEQGKDYQRTLIDVLLGAPVAGTPAGGPYTPYAFQGSAWRYNPQNPNAFAFTPNWTSTPGQQVANTPAAQY